MDVILINLARAPERLQRMQAQFMALQMIFQVLVATDGKTISDAERNLVDNERRKWITAFPLTDNEIGCWLSHRRAMEQLIASGKPMAVVIEDDASLSSDLPRVLTAIEERAAPFDIIDLHRNFRRNEIFVPCRPLLPALRLGRIGYTHMNATAYVVSREGAQKFLAFAPRFAHAFDKELHRYWANGLDIYGLEKPVAEQDDGGHSYIDETRSQDKPQQRLRYADADDLKWRMARKLTRLYDSIFKRWAFAAYVRKGRKAGVDHA
jgi:glycosyl transferase family 25